MKRSGRKSLSQTKAPLKEQIKGSKANPKGSASSKSKASKIILSEKILDILKKKKEKYNKSHTKDVDTNSLKAVMRRGMGAYSTSHRPGMTRQGWGFARVNKFLLKKGGAKVKAAYVQDDDLLKKGGKIQSFFEKGGESKFYKGYSINNEGNYIKNENMDFESKLSISDIDHKYPNIPHSFINEQLIKGIRVEMEHTDKPQIARKIALDHLDENPFYYEYLDKMEEELKNLDIDKHFEEIQHENYYARGGNLEAYEFNTPSGFESKLSYLQQVLVRTKAFKNWFGDWEIAAKSFLLDGQKNFKKHYTNVSKVIDMVTLEPKVGFHGTKEENEFYSFATNKETGTGRPYGYFAENREYSMNFIGGSNLLYAAFLNIKNPFIARGSLFTEKKFDWIDASVSIVSRMAQDKYPEGGLEYNEEVSRLAKVHESQIWDYLRKTYENENYNFWLLMAKDLKSEFKNFIISHGYDGIFADEQFRDPYDKKKPSEFTNTFIIFDASQVKLADGRNTKFNPMSSDIRYEKGAQLDMPNEEQAPQILSKGGKMRALLLENKYKSGGALKNDNGIKDDAKDGGLFVGQSHANGGIKAYNVSTQQPIEVEGGEVIITKKAVHDGTKKEFEGEMLTNKEILSRINESGGGVSFEDGGQVHGCGCSGKKYNYGGETLEDFMIIKKMNDVYNMSLSKSVSYVNSLMNKIK
jgi:hypothetical protein